MQVEVATADPPEPGRARALNQMLERGWPWIAAVTAVALAQLGFGQSSASYESTGTYIVRPRGDAAVTNIQAAANLNGTVRIDVTFARIAESDLVVDRAWASFAPAESGGVRRDADVSATVTRSSNILSISARTADPSTAHALATAVGTETVRYIDRLGDLYDLTVLDPPTEARRSSSAPVPAGRLLGAGLVGLGLGIVTRPIVRRRLWAGDAAGSPFALDTGVGNEQYTRLRIREERDRTKNSGLPFHLLVVRPDVVALEPCIRATTRAISSALREEDHLGLLADKRSRTFVAVLPGRTDEQVEQLMAEIRHVVVRRIRRRYGPHVAVAVHSCRYAGEGFEGEALAVEIAEAL